MMRTSLILSLFILFSTTLFAQPARVVADKIVAVVGNKIILKSDIDNSMMDMQRQQIPIPENAACLMLEQAMGIKALVLQAEKDSIPVTDEEIEVDIDNRVRYFISQYGSKEELETVAGKSIYQMKEDFRDGFRDQKLAAAMRNKIIENVKITPNEVKKYFETIPTDSLAFYESEVEIGQVVVFPKATREAEQYAIEQLAGYKKDIESGKKDFKSLASLYSEDPGSKERGGQYEINRNQKDLDPVWMSKGLVLKEGQVSNPFKTKFGYHIIQLVSRSGDDAVVRHILRIPQITTYETQAGISRLDSVRAKLIAGTIDFGTAVAKYNEDEASKFTAGMLQGRDGSFLTIDQLDKSMVPILSTLKVGEYSQPQEYVDERGKKAVRIVYLKTKTEPHRENMKDDYSRIASRALEEKKESALEKWFDSRISTYYIMVGDDYKNCDSMKKWVNASMASKNY